MPSTAQGWRVATGKVLDRADSDEEQADVRRIDVDAVFRAFLNRNPAGCPRSRSGSTAGGSGGRSRSS